MDRRLLIMALAALTSRPLFAQHAAERPRHKVSIDTLQDAVSARFPVRFGIAGLLQVQVGTPRLFLMPSRNKLGASLHALVTSAEVRQPQAGELDVAFALRYERTDRTLRAHDLEVLDLRAPSLPAETAQALRSLLPLLAKEAVGEVVLHRFSPRELALADTMGFEPESILVVRDGLVIVFGPRARP